MTTILVIDDHPIFRKSLDRLLRTYGNYEVVTAASSEQALEMVQHNKFDLALIDVSLPARSGIWLVERIREVRPELPCLMLSGLANMVYVQQSIEAGARGYVLKDDVPGITEGIRVVLDGGTFISDALAAT